MSATPPIDLKDAVDALAGARARGKIAVAVSGGSDSMALLHLAANAFPDQLHALTVDHRLRVQSAAEALQVKRWCKAISIPHTTLKLAQAPGGSLQAAAREARYEAMQHWCERHRVALLLAAHQQDDVAEGLLIRLARGSGLVGLAAMKAARPLGLGVTFLRPLLHCSRESLRSYLRSLGQPWIEDSSNADDRFERVRARRLLAEGHMAGLNARRLAETAQRLADASDALDWVIERLAGEAIPDGRDLLLPSRAQLPGMPMEVQRRLLLRLIDRVRGAGIPPRQGDISRLLARMTNPQWRGSSLAGCIFRPEGDGLRIVRE